MLGHRGETDQTDTSVPHTGDAPAARTCHAMHAERSARPLFVLPRLPAAAFFFLGPKMTVAFGFHRFGRHRYPPLSWEGKRKHVADNAS